MAEQKKPSGSLSQKPFADVLAGRKFALEKKEREERERAEDKARIEAKTREIQEESGEKALESVRPVAESEANETKEILPEQEAPAAEPQEELPVAEPEAEPKTTPAEPETAPYSAPSLNSPVLRRAAIKLSQAEMDRNKYDEVFERFLTNVGAFKGHKLHELILGQNHFTAEDMQAIDLSLGFTAMDRARVDKEADLEFNRYKGARTLKNCQNRAFKSWFNKKYPAPMQQKMVFNKLIGRLRDIHERIEDEEGMPIITPFMKRFLAKLQLALIDHYAKNRQNKISGKLIRESDVQVEFYNCLGSTMDTYFFTDAILVINVKGNPNPTYILLDITKDPSKISRKQQSEDTVILGFDEPNAAFRQDEESFLISVFNQDRYAFLRQNLTAQSNRDTLLDSMVNEVVSELTRTEEINQPKERQLML